jgi:hypothetical protein
MTTESKVGYSIIAATLCALGFIIGSDHQKSQDVLRIAELETQIKYNKMLLRQPCLRASEIKGIVFNYTRKTR